MSTHLLSFARGRVAFVAAALAAVVLALTRCDSGSGDDIAAAPPSGLVDETSAEPSNTYVVDSGDTLSGIAAGYGVSLGELVGVNEWSDGSDHAIFPGDVIGLPDDAVAVSTTRAPSNNNSNGDDDDNESDGSGTSSTAAMSGGYTATGEAYVGPTLDGSTDPIIDPLPDGVYWSFEPSVSDDGSTITFEVVQQFSGDTCREHFGTSNSCLSDIDFETATELPRCVSVRGPRACCTSTAAWMSRRTGRPWRSWPDCSRDTACR